MKKRTNARVKGVLDVHELGTNGGDHHLMSSSMGIGEREKKGGGDYRRESIGYFIVLIVLVNPGKPNTVISRTCVYS